MVEPAPTLFTLKKPMSSAEFVPLTLTDLTSHGLEAVMRLEAAGPKVEELLGIACGHVHRADARNDSGMRGSSCGNRDGRAGGEGVFAESVFSHGLSSLSSSCLFRVSPGSAHHSLEDPKSSHIRMTKVRSEDLM